MKRLLLLLALAAMALAAAQEKKEEPPRKVVQKLFVLKYADPQQVANLIRVFTTNVTPNSTMHALAVSATPEAMTAIEDAIKRLDVSSAAPQNIELTAYMLVGGETPPAGPPPPAIPKDLDSVVTQLRNAFPYKEYRLMDILTLRTRTGQRAETSSTGSSVNIGGIRQPIITQFRIDSATVNPEGTIRINGLRVGNRVPVATGSFQPGVGGAGVNPLVNTQFSYQDVGLNTDVDIKEGQKLVVGKMGMNSNEAIFLVLIARVAL